MRRTALAETPMTPYRETREPCSECARREAEAKLTRESRDVLRAKYEAATEYSGRLAKP